MKSEKWLKILYDRNYKGLYRLASHLLYTQVGHTADVQDILQEVFLLALRKEVYRHPNPDAWLIVATRNICKNYARSSRRSDRKNNRIADDQFSKNVHNTQIYAESSIDETRFSDILISLEQSLSLEDRDLMWKYCVEDRPIYEIAEATGLSCNAVRMRICRIRLRLKKLL